jgi:ATP-dependent RNA helicase DeaD
VIPIYGGVNIDQVWKDIKSSHNKNHIMIATPGKLIDMVKKKAISLQSRCSFVVLDEADTMLSLGFQK